MYGFLLFKDPPLPFEINYWNENFKTYNYESASECIGIEPDKIIDASLIPIPDKRKTSSEIVCLFKKILKDNSEKNIRYKIFGNNNPQRFSVIYLKED